VQGHSTLTERVERIGHIVRLGGGVADIRFGNGLPAITNRLVTMTDPEIVIEVAALPSDTIARGLVMNPSPDLRIGLAVRDTGGPIEVPVGEEVLGRMFNLFGETIDNGPPLGDVLRRPILRAPVPLSERRVEGTIFETGIKAIDLLSPLESGGKAGCSAARASERRC
jgi:F-type H+/Na+-transporting ATPase subunit beta